MKISLFNQQKHFKSYLDKLKRAPVMSYDPQKLIEKTYRIEILNCTGLDQLDLAFFFDYRIFPPHILIGYPEWRDEQRSLQPGDTILQQIYLPPIPKFSQKALFGTRIKAVIQEKNRCGFSYETLKGHVERGISYFLLEENNGKITFTIQTFSEPGNWLSRLFAPVFSIPYQNHCTKKALKNVKQTLESTRASK